MAGNGTAIVVWDRFVNGAPLATKGFVQARARAADGTWTPVLANAPQQLGGPYSGAVRYEPRVAADPIGNALAVWLDSSNMVAGAARSTAGGWGGIQEIAAANAANFYPRVALDADGLATVAWCGPASPSGYEVKVRRRPVGAPFESTTTSISEPETQKCRPEVAAGPGGTALVLWRHHPDGLIRGNVRPAGGQFGASRDISKVGGANLASGAFDGAGNAVAAWHRTAGVEAAGFDTAAPVARDVSVPAAATTGSPVAFDAWSAVTVAWDFGDGKSATGGAVSNTYVGAGRFEVTLTLTDAVGNATASKHVVVVTDPPAPPGGTGTAPAPTGGGTTPGTGTGTGTGTVPPPLPRILTKVGAHWLAFPTYSRLTRFEVVDVPAGATVEVRCTGRRSRRKKVGCPYVSRKFQVPKARKTLNLFRLFRGRRLLVATKLEIRTTAPGHIGRVVSYTVRRRKTPKPVIRCLPPGGAPTRC